MHQCRSVAALKPAGLIRVGRCLLVDSRPDFPFYCNRATELIDSATQRTGRSDAGITTCLQLPFGGKGRPAAMTGAFACVLGFEMSTAGFASAGSRLGRTGSRTNSWTGFCWRHSLSAPADRAGGELSFVIRPTARTRQPEKESFRASVGFGQHRIGTLVAPVDPFQCFVGRHKSPGSSTRRDAGGRRAHARAVCAGV